MRIDFTWTRSESGLLLVTAHYMLDVLAFKKWVTEDMAKVSKQHFMFMDLGLVIAIRDGKWDKADFLFANGSHDDIGLNSTWIPLNLLSHESIFRIHRDLGCPEDWIVYYDEPMPERAAQTASA